MNDEVGSGQVHPLYFKSDCCYDGAKATQSPLSTKPPRKPRIPRVCAVCRQGPADNVSIYRVSVERVFRCWQHISDSDKQGVIR